MKPAFEGGRWIVELRPQGPMRFVVAGFLLFWLAGWATGEVFAVSSAMRMLAGGAAGSGPAVVFLALWLALWTSGGLLAFHQALRHLIGYDRIEYDGAGLKRLSGLGPFLGGRSIARSELQGVSITGQGLVARTATGTVVLSRFGSAEERAELLQDLRRELQLDGGATDSIGATPDQPPAGWESAVEPDGTVTLRKRRGALDPLRRDYRLAPGRIEATVGIGRPRPLECGTPALAIEHWKDSDGDRLYRLVIHHAGGRSEVAQVIDDPFPLVQLGRWMARRIERPLSLPRELEDRFAA